MSLSADNLEALRRAVNAECTCGGGPRGVGSCPACNVWHRMMPQLESRYGPPDCEDCHKAVQEYGRRQKWMMDRGNFGIVPLPLKCKRHLNQTT